MHEAPLMQRSEAFRDAGEHRYEIGPRAAAPGAKIAAARVLEDRKAGITVRCALAGKQVRMAQACLEAGGVEKSSAQRRLALEIGREDLQRDVARLLTVPGEPNLAPPPRAEPAQQDEPRSQNLPDFEHASPDESQGGVAPDWSAPVSVEVVAAGSPVSFS